METSAESTCRRVIVGSCLLLSVLAAVDSLTNEGDSRQTYVVRYKGEGLTIPVTVVLDYKKQTEYVINMTPRSPSKSVTFYDFKERIIAYKDLSNRECFLDRLSHESLQKEHTVLKKLQNPVNNDPPVVLTLEPGRPSLTPTEVRNMAGHKSAMFCRGMSTWLLIDRQAPRRTRRQTSHVVQRTYGHYGQQSNNYAHYGHETYSITYAPNRIKSHGAGRHQISPRTRNRDESNHLATNFQDSTLRGINNASLTIHHRHHLHPTSSQDASNFTDINPASSLTASQNTQSHPTAPHATHAQFWLPGQLQSVPLTTEGHWPPETPRHNHHLSSSGALNSDDEDNIKQGRFDPIYSESNSDTLVPRVYYQHLESVPNQDSHPHIIPQSVSTNHHLKDDHQGSDEDAPPHHHPSPDDHQNGGPNNNPHHHPSPDDHQNGELNNNPPPPHPSPEDHQIVGPNNNPHHHPSPEDHQNGRLNNNPHHHPSSDDHQNGGPNNNPHRHPSLALLFPLGPLSSGTQKPFSLNTHLGYELVSPIGLYGHYNSEYKSGSEGIPNRTETHSASFLPNGRGNPALLPQEAQPEQHYYHRNRNGEPNNNPYHHHHPSTEDHRNGGPNNNLYHHPSPEDNQNGVPNNNPPHHHPSPEDHQNGRLNNNPHHHPSSDDHQNGGPNNNPHRHPSLALLFPLGPLSSGTQKPFSLNTHLGYELVSPIGLYGHYNSEYKSGSEGIPNRTETHSASFLPNGRGNPALLPQEAQPEQHYYHRNRNGEPNNNPYHHHHPSTEDHRNGGPNNNLYHHPSPEDNQNGVPNNNPPHHHPSPEDHRNGGPNNNLYHHPLPEDHQNGRLNNNLHHHPSPEDHRNGEPKNNPYHQHPSTDLHPDLHPESAQSHPHRNTHHSTPINSSPDSVAASSDLNHFPHPLFTSSKWHSEISKVINIPLNGHHSPGLEKEDYDEDGEMITTEDPAAIDKPQKSPIEVPSFEGRLDYQDPINILHQKNYRENPIQDPFRSSPPHHPNATKLIFPSPHPNRQKMHSLLNGNHRKHKQKSSTNKRRLFKPTPVGSSPASNITVEEGIPRRQERLSNVLHLFTPDEIVIDIEKYPTGDDFYHSAEALHSAFDLYHNATSRKPSPRAEIKRTGTRTRTSGHLRQEQQSGRKWRSSYAAPNFPSPSFDPIRRSDDGSASNDHQLLLPPGVSVHPRHPQAPYASLASASAKRTMLNSLQSNADRIRHGRGHPKRHHRQHRKRNGSCCQDVAASTSNGESPTCCSSSSRMGASGVLSCCSGRRRGQRPPTCCQQLSPGIRRHHRRPSPETSHSDVTGRHGDAGARDPDNGRCQQDTKMCRTLYQSTRRVLVCRTAQADGC